MGKYNGFGYNIAYLVVMAFWFLSVCIVLTFEAASGDKSEVSRV